MSAYNDSVLYVHIPKCGGISVKKYMREHLEGLTWHQGDERSPDYPAPIGHIPLRDIEKYTGRKLDSWETIIATVRDPYAQQLSQWRFWTDRRARGQSHELDMCASLHHGMEGFLRDGRCDFIAWYEAVHGTAGGWPHAPLNIDLYQWFLEVDGATPPNLHVVKMEDMEQLLPPLLGLESKHAAGRAPFPHENKGIGRGDVSDYYNLVATSLLEYRFQWTWNREWYDMWAEQEVRRIA